MNEVVFKIDDLPPGINKLLRMNRFDRRKAAHAWGYQMKAAVKWDDIAQLKAWSALEGKLSISMHVTTNQLYDSDNLASLGKIPLDSMKALGWIQDDSNAFVHFEPPTQEKAKQKSIRFTIRPASDGVSK